MIVWCNRWLTIMIAFVLLQGESFFSLKGDKKMSMYKKVSTDMNFVDREKATEAFWKENHIFEKSMESRKEG